VSFRVRLANIDDGPGICRLFGRAFPRQMSLAEWRWKYPDNPDGWLSVVAEVDAEIAAHYGGWGARLLLEGREMTLFSLCDLSTDPERRGLGGKHGMLRAMAEEWNGLLRERRLPFSYGFPGAHVLRVGGPLVGYAAHFPIREIRLPLAGVAPAGQAGTDVAGPSFEELWHVVKPSVAAAGLVRDRARVNWRFHARPDRYYRMVSLESSGECLAWGVLSVFGADALVMDYLTRDPSGEAFEELSNRLAAEAAAMGASTLVFWESPGGPWREALGEQARRAGGKIVDAGFSFATAALFDEPVFRRFLDRIPLTPSFYDDR
jgi:hypothetical protein